MPEFESKESSNLGWARYDEAKQTLQVDFKAKNGTKYSTYEYENFSPDMWAQFNAADSKGKFFAYVIRPHYKGVKIWPKQ